MTCLKSSSCGYGCMDGQCGHPYADDELGMCPERIEMMELMLGGISCEEDKEDRENGIW